MSATARRSGSKMARIIARAADPSPGSGEIRLYSKLLSSVAELFVLGETGIVNQMTGPGAVIPRGYIAGLGLSWTSITEVTVAVGRVRSSDDTCNLVLAAPAVCDITVSGIGGLDTGVEAGDTWYAVYVIGDSTGAQPTGVILSASFVSPTFPPGYDIFRRIGCVRNGAGSDFLAFHQRWSGRVRRYWYDEARATLQVLTNGNSTVAAAVSCAALMPTTSRNAVFGIDFLAPSVGGANANVLNIRPTGNIAAPATFRAGVTATASMLLNAELPVSAAQSIDYLVSDSDDVANLFVLAFDDNLS